MLKLKLSRIGKKNQPAYRLVVLEHHKDPWGDCLEFLGQYNPKANPKIIQFKADRIKYWLSKGAQPSPTVHNLLVDQKIIDQPKVVASSGKKRGKALAQEAEKAKAGGIAKATKAASASVPSASSGTTADKEAPKVAKVSNVAEVAEEKPAEENKA